VSVATEPIDPEMPAESARIGLRERKKDATRRALAEAALNLAVERGYAAVTIADITDAVGVSRRTFSNYCAGKAECIAAVAEGWFDDIAQSISAAPADHPLDQILCDALLRIAAELPERWERFFGLFHVEPELKAMVGAIDQATCGQLAQVVAPRLGMTPDDIRVRMLSSFGTIAGRTCLEDWILRGRPDGDLSFQAQLELAFSIIDLNALQAQPPLPDDRTAVPVPGTINDHEPPETP
jgi:AcrR family transcriptional regulator